MKVVALKNRSVEKSLFQAHLWGIQVTLPNSPMRELVLLFLLTTSAVAQAEIAISDAWVRATPPGARTAAVYMDLTSSGAADALVSVNSNVAGEAQLHTHRHDQGMMRMEQVNRFDLPLDQLVALKPGGKHLMLIDIFHPLVPGETVELELIFEQQAPLKIQVPVRDGRTR